jgi:hypothetical protein
MDIEKPTIEEFFDSVNSNGGLNESRHAPKNPTIDPPKQPIDSPQQPPIGPKVWREKRVKKHQSKKPNVSNQKVSDTKSKLDRLEADISKLKEIRAKEKETRKPKIERNIKSAEQGWTQVQRKQRKISPPKTLRVNGRYKLVIGSADDGTRVDCNDIQWEVQSDPNN